MAKLIFAALVLVAGVTVYGALKRQMLVRGPLAGVVGRLVLVLSIGVPALIVLFSVFRIIPAGHVGVKVLFGQVEAQPLREGLNVVLNPLYDVVDMDVRVVKHTARYDAASKDLQAVHVEMVLNYRVMPDRAPEVYRNIGLNFSSVIIDPAAQEVLKANTATHNAEEILLQRPQIKADVQRDLTTWLAKYGLEMKEAALANIRFDPAYEKAVEAKQIEQQKAEQKRYELIQAQRQAEIVAAEAKGKGDAALAEARGVADALRVKGEAEATYNARVASSLTPVLIQQQYLARWDGRLPQYSFGGGAVPFVQLPGAADGSRR
jgi:regulator of protease activity HflC (stomatin/prohibitin superfamily)